MKHNPFFRMALLALGVFAGSLVASCGTYDFGGEAPTEILVNVEKPNWNADIRPLMVVKCMNCHASPKPKHAPPLTPVLKFDDEVLFRESLSLSVARTVFETQTMPKNFATPLSANERAALKKYLTTTLGITVREGTGGKPATGGGGAGGVVWPSAYVTHCQGCHLADGSGDRSGGTGPKLIGYNKLESEFKSLVRNGRGIMPKKNATEVSDSDVSEIYKVIKTLK